MRSRFDLTPILSLPIHQRISVVKAILDSIANDIPQPDFDGEVKAMITDEPHNIENADGKKL